MTKGEKKGIFLIDKSLLAFYAQKLIKISEFIIVPCPEKQMCFFYSK